MVGGAWRWRWVEEDVISNEEWGMKNVELSMGSYVFRLGFVGGFVL